MLARTKRFSVAMLSAAFLFAGTLVPSASAQNQDGLVNVMIGDVNILNDANIGVAANVAANVCGVNVGPVAVLATVVLLAARAGRASRVSTDSLQTLHPTLLRAIA